MHAISPSSGKISCQKRQSTSPVKKKRKKRKTAYPPCQKGSLPLLPKRAVYPKKKTEKKMQKKKQKEEKYINNKYCRPGTWAPLPEWATWLIQAHAKQQQQQHLMQLSSDANSKCHQQNGSNKCKYFIKRLYSLVSERPFGHRRWKPARVLELKNVAQLCWKRNIDCFRTPVHTLCSPSPLDVTNQMKQSQLEVNVLWAAEFIGEEK